MGKDPHHILLVKARAIGDSVMGLSSVDYLKSLYPEAQITYAIPSWIAPLFEKLETSADSILPINLKKPTDWYKFWRQVANLNADHIHEMHQSGRTKKFFKTFSTTKRIPYTAHNHHLKEDPRVYDQGLIKPLIQRDLDGIWSFLGKEEKPPSYLDFPPKMSAKINVDHYSPTIVFGVVATRETKYWPLKHYVELAHQIKQESPKTKFLVPLSPSEQDQKLKEELRHFELPQDFYFLEVPLNQLPLELSKAKLYIGNDTGLKHICLSLGVKTYTLFGPEPPLEWHPYDAEKHPYFYREGLECRTRYAHYCALETCESMICLNQITPEHVYKNVKADLLT